MLKTPEIENILESNSYPGRGIIIGMSSDGCNAVIAYFIMGRSANSRNRIFMENGSEVTIYPYDKSKVSDPRLIIYSPIRQLGKSVIVTNGDQTDTIYSFLQNEKTFEEALKTRTYEPDAPNYTPRISGIIDIVNNSISYKLGILKTADSQSGVCERLIYSYKGAEGEGHFIHTYKCDGNPLPSFEGEPVKIKIVDDIDLFANKIWNSLCNENKISLYVRYIDLKNGNFKSRIYNKNQGEINA